MVMSWGVSIGIIVAFLLIPIDIIVTRKVKRRSAYIFESTKIEGALLHEKCMLQTKRKECPAVITVCNDNLTIYPVIGANIEIPIKNLHIMPEGGFLQNSRYPWWNKQIVTLQDDRDSSQFSLGLDNSEKLKNIVKTNG